MRSSEANTENRHRLKRCYERRIALANMNRHGNIFGKREDSRNLSYDMRRAPVLFEEHSRDNGHGDGSVCEERSCSDLAGSTRRSFLLFLDVVAI